MVVGVFFVIFNIDNSILVEIEFWNCLLVNEKYIIIFF